jgi:dihydroorotase-like cyclic amidohydrolase
MAKLALISKHLVLTEINSESARYPVPGVILIDSGNIKDVVIVPESDLPIMFQRYSDWNPLDYTDYYISPGLIDLNCRKEWETLEQLSYQSLSGGFTCITLEPGHFISQGEVEGLYCDVCQVEIINESTSFSSIPSYIRVLKAYLFPPSPGIKSVSNLDHVIKSALSTGLPLMIDPSLPDPRMLYMASPLRLESLDQRNKLEVNSGSTVFAAAFPEPTDTHSDSESGNSETEDLKRPKTLSLQPSEISAICKLRRSISSEKLLNMTVFEATIQEEEDLKQSEIGKSLKINDIYQALDAKIKEQQQNIEDLCKAEKITYNCSGATRFQFIDPPKKSASLPSIIFNVNSPDRDEREERPVRKRRPAPIEVRSPNRSDLSRDYHYYLANCPDHWETAGIEKVLECLTSSSKVHFFNLSSATSFNLIRKSKKRLKSLTCDVSSTNLFFHSSHILSSDTRFKNSPPIRNQGNNSLLWEMLKMKCIDCISSSHSAIEPGLKLSGNFSQTINGIPSSGLCLSSVWTRLNSTSSSLEQLEHYIVRLAKWFSAKPAEVIGIDHLLGKIEKGKRADLVIWKPWEKQLVEHKAYEKVSPFVGQKMMGKVLKVYMKGVLVFDLGKEKEPMGEVLLR